ncbi:MAG TPA: methyl-accepting chemotaxis protein, partial [Spirochaetota bacterium]|nr:methyl-accepting chemotaxis protein [Spirochaetota bacterium]
IGKTGYPFITNKSGMTIAHPEAKYIFQLDVNKYDWGQQMMSSASGSTVYYEWEGMDKFLTFNRNDKYNFIVATTMYMSDINEQARSMAFIMFIIAVAAIIASAVFIYTFIARRLSPLDECKDIMSSMSLGNLAVRYNGVNRQDEIGEISKAMNDSMQQFEQVIAEIIAASQNLGQAVQEIAGGNENLSQRTSEQASSLEEVASTIEEATASIKQNVDNAITANKKAVESSRMAEDGGRVVADAVNAINDVSQYSKKIGDIISVINEIAFQTNLLALNAAVEAARAGEQGRGFAVVAGEVRNLAQRAGSSAKEISQLIKDSVDKVAIGTELANKSGEALKEIIQSVKSVAQMVAEISAASEEQKRGVDQINIAIGELDTMTQQNAALVEETASASEEMSNQSQELQVMMEKFKIRDDIRSDVFSKKRKELHLHTEALSRDHGKNDDGNGRKKIAPVAAQDAKSRDIKDILTKEGFEEF